MKEAQQIVIKVGTSTLTQGTSNLSQRHILEIARQIALLHESGKQIILVTSGSVTAGLEVLRKSKLEKSLPRKQMLSAVGQVRLMQIWTEMFGIFGIPVGQLLLTRGDFSQRQGYLNVRNTLLSLFEHGVVPIINENDSVAIREIQLGDNDNLSALAANLIAADLLILLTDQEGLFTADPQIDPNAKLIPIVEHIDESIVELAGKTTKTHGMGTGGMLTKVEAARLASHSGTPTVIASSAVPRIILDLVKGKKIGTLFLAETTPKESRKRWLLSEKPQGEITIDAGAEQKLLKGGASLLPVGILSVSKSFDRGAIVQITTSEGRPIAVGIANYSQREIEKICGKHSTEIDNLLGYNYGPEVIHRDNMTLLIQEGGSKDDRK
ncbi:MAG: Glutamate 5-kinase [Chlamydiae bacterium]|nr:Glutamate 5-kinase [Chlamydiota bacterium]